MIILSRWVADVDSLCLLGKNYVGETFLHVKNFPAHAIVIILYHRRKCKAKYCSLICVCTRYHLLFRFAVEHLWQDKSREGEKILTNKFHTSGMILHLEQF